MRANVVKAAFAACCLLFALGALAAERIFVLKDGVLEASPKVVELVKREGGALGEEANRVNEKKEAFLWLRLAQGRTLKSLTFAVELKLDALPAANSGLISRPGFHNVLSVRKDGAFSFAIWGRDKKTYCETISRTRAKPGVEYSVVGVVERIDDDEYELAVYVNGKEESRATLGCPAMQYGSDMFIGAAAFSNGTAALPFNGDILGASVYDGALDDDEIAGLEIQARNMKERPR